jgi:hypothetical protein
MPTEVHATRSQVEAAKGIVERNSAMGHPTPEAIRKIAEAEMVDVSEGSIEEPEELTRAAALVIQLFPDEPRASTGRKRR